MKPCRAYNLHEPHLALIAGHSIRNGGMEKFARNLVGTMLSANWQVTVALSGENIFQNIVPQAPHLLTTEQVDWLDHSMKGDREYYLSRIIQRYRWFRRVEPDVAVFIQSSNTPLRASIVGAYLAGVPVVTTHRTMPYVIPEVPSKRYLFGLIPGIGLHQRRLIFKTWLTAALAARLVYNSHQVRRCYEHDYHYPKRKGRVIVNAVDLPPMNTSPRYDADIVTIGYVGRLGWDKQLHVLLKAISLLHTKKKVRLLMYGEGTQQPELAELADELNIAGRIEWCGPTDDIESAYSRIDIVTLCSVRESSSNMVLEAMAAGKAVVVTEVGGLPELIGHGRYGLSVPPSDPQALASALTELIEDDNHRLEIGAQARLAAQTNHNPRRVSRAWIELLTEVAQQHLLSRFPTRRCYNHASISIDDQTGLMEKPA